MTHYIPSQRVPLRLPSGQNRAVTAPKAGGCQHLYPDDGDAIRAARSIPSHYLRHTHGSRQ